MRISKAHLKRLFTREESIAGLDVSDTGLRLALLERDSDKNTAALRVLAEEPLPDGTVRQGVIVNRDRFVLGAKNILKKSVGKIRYAVVSVPSDRVYFQNIVFPKTVRGQKLADSMKLVENFQLPTRADDAYTDWKRLPTDDRTEVLLASLPKAISNEYVAALKAAGLNTVALEFHPLSFMRVMEYPRDQIALIRRDDAASTSFFIVDKDILRFIRVIPHQYVPLEKMDDEARKLADFYQSEHDQAVRRINANSSSIAAPYAADALFKGTSSAWLVSVGAAVRGLLPRSEDKDISLLSIGTSEAYEYQKAIVFGEFISNLAVGVSIFFAALFVGVWLMMLTLQQRATTQLVNQSLPAPPDTIKLLKNATKFNHLVYTASDIAKKLPRWAPILGEVKSRTLNGISVKNFSFGTPESTLNLSGTAQSRSVLNAFKKNLEESPLFTDINLPLTLLDQKENIPFSVTFRLKDPGLAYTTH